jgi:hypothetical protein
MMAYVLFTTIKTSSGILRGHITSRWRGQKFVVLYGLFSMVLNALKLP